MEYAIGIVLALAISGMATAVGFDRDRALYPFIAMLVASYYGLFAIMSGSTATLLAESIVIGAFVVISILGFKFNLWLVVALLAGHGVFDFFIHAHVIRNLGVPEWWPGFCGAYDIVAAGYLAWNLRSRLEAKRPPSFSAESLKPENVGAAAP